jgi:VanZ family protein
MKSLQTAARIAAWIALALICFVTLSNAHLRPYIFRTGALDRVVGFAVLGFLLILAYPQRPGVIAILVIGAAVALELLQLVTPDRDARLIDAAEKMAGGMIGMASARYLWVAITARMRS